MELLFLGTASMTPTTNRNVSALAMRVGTAWWVFDCGEGTQHQMNKGYYDYLDEAAEKGHVFAQHAISRLTVDRYMDAQGFTSLPRDDFIEKRDAFVARQRAFLEQAVAQGSFPAMKRLAGLHHAQKTGSGGYVNAFALNQVILTLTDDN